MASLDVHLLGRTALRLVDGGVPADLDLPPQQTALLVYLALARPRGVRTRDGLVGLFWPEQSDRRARAALSQALYRLRRVLPDGMLRTRGDHEVVLELEPATCDVMRFEQAVAEERFRDALEEYGGELMDGFHLAGAGEFERWLAGERQHFDAQVRRIVREVAESAGEDDNPAAVARCLERALGLSPYEEEVAGALVLALARCGDVPGALLQHESFVERLRDDLELDPSPDFLALADVARQHPRRLAPIPAAPTPVAIDDVVPPSDTARGQDSPAAPGERPFRTRVFTPVAVSVLMAAVIGIWAISNGSAAAPPDLHPNRVLVASFPNRTGEPTLDLVGLTAADWIAQGLARTGMIEVVPADAWLRSARSQGREPPSLLDLARQVGAGLVLTGGVDRRGDSLLLQAQIMRVPGGTLVHAIEAVRGSLLDPMPAIELLRQRSAGSVASVLDPRLSSWTVSATTPPSFEAYRSLVAALDLFTAGRYDSALEGFSRAASTHPGFTSAVIWAAHTHTWAGRDAKAGAVAATLEPLRDSLPPWDLAMLDYYQARSINDWESAYHAISRAVQVAPRSEWSYLRAGAANQLGRPSEALQILIDTGPGLAPPWYPYWSTRLKARHRLGDYEGELEDLASARADLDVGQERLEQVELRAFAGLGRMEDALAAMEDLYAAAPELSGRTRILRSARGEFLAHGRPDLAAEMAERELQVRLAQPAADRTPRQQVELGRALYWTGRLEEARGLIESLPLEYDPGNIPGYLALIAAAQGRPDEARRISDEIAESFTEPESEFWKVLWQARIATALGEEERALSLLEGAIQRNRMGRFESLGHDPDLAPLFPFPRFQALLRTDRGERSGG